MPEALPKFHRQNQLMTSLVPIWPQTSTILQVTLEALPKFIRQTQLTTSLVPIPPPTSTIIHVTLEALPKFHIYEGSGGNKKLPPCRYCTVGIVRDIRQKSTQLPPQTSSPWWPVCPPYGVHSINHPNPMHGRPFEGAGQGWLGGVIYKSLK